MQILQSKAGIAVPKNGLHRCVLGNWWRDRGNCAPLIRPQ